MTAWFDKYYINLKYGAVLCLMAAICMPAANGAKLRHPKVAVTTAKQDVVVNEIRLTGTISSPRVSRLSAEVSGLIQHIHVEEGDAVQAGDVLVTLDNAMAALSLQVAEASTQRAQAELDDAKRRLADGEQLAKKRTLSENDLETLQAEVNIAVATLQRYLTEQKLQQKRVKRHRLYAPYAGVISKKLTESGEWIQPGDAVMELVDDKNLRVDFQAPQKELPRINPATTVDVYVDALPQQAFKGKIKTLIPYSDANTRTFPLHVTLNETHPAIAPGMSVSGVLHLTTSRNIVISRDAILQHPDGRITAWVINRSDGVYQVSEKRIRIGASFHDKVEILHGLKVGDQVVIEGNESLRSGQVVTLSP